MLATTRRSLPLPVPGREEPASTDLGPPSAWARDLAVVGAATGLVVTKMAYDLGMVALTIDPFFHPEIICLAAAAAGALSGALLGHLLPRLTRGFVRKVPVLLLMGAAAGLGALWGGLIGTVAAGITETPLAHLVYPAALAGMLQLGWLWLPYTLMRARKVPTWPVVVGAVGMSAPIACFAVLNAWSS